MHDLNTASALSRSGIFPRSSAPRLPVHGASHGVYARLLERRIPLPVSMTSQEALHLQRLYGNRFVQRYVDASARRDDSARVEQELARAERGGQPLDRSVRANMEGAFQYDFGGVRVHTDTDANSLSRAVDAVAFTTGQHVFFRQGAYNPTSASGQELLAHELTHVVQQTAAPAPAALTISDPADLAEREAESVARAVATQNDGMVRVAQAQRGAEVLRQDAGSAGAVTPDAGSAPKEDADIVALDLSPTAKAAAIELKKKHPEITFTSGRRDVHDQAHAIASNIVTSKNRKWIEQTYVSAAQLQKWVDDNPKAVTVDEITMGLEGLMTAMADADLGKISKHLSGDAFDVQPQSKDADAIKIDIKALTGLTKFLDQEGGLVRWHAQF